MLWLILLNLLPMQEETLVMAERFYQAANYFEAEGHLLAADPSAADVPMVGRRLAEIALRLNSIDTKRNFYDQAINERTGHRQAAILFAKAGLDAKRRDWQTFARTALDYLANRGSQATEFGDYQILYYLARYTPIHLPSDLGLPEAATAWFRDCRELGAASAYPANVRANWPVSVRLLSHLADPNPSLAPRLPNDEPTMRYFHGLAVIHTALASEDYAAAAMAINDQFPLDKNLNRSDLRVLFYPLLIQYFRANQAEDKARTTDRNLLLSRQWAVLPLVTLPEDLAVPGEWELPEANTTASPLDPPPIASEPLESAESVVEDASETVATAAERVTEETESVVEDASETVETTAAATTDAANEAVTDTETVVVTAAERAEVASEEADDAVTEVSEGVKDAAEMTADAAEETVTDAEAVADIAVESAEAATEAVTAEADPAVSDIADTVETSADATAETADEALADAESAADTVVDEADTAVSNVAENAESATAATAEAAESIAEPVEEMVETTQTAIAAESTEPTPPPALPSSSQTPVDLKAAQTFMSQGQYLTAEGFLLAGEPQRDQIAPVALALTTIAQRTNTVTGKSSFFESYLTRSRNWRGTATLTLAALAVAQQDWQRLDRFGRLFFEENRDLRHPRLYELLYYLARYTDVQAADLNLESDYAAWFNSFLQIPQDKLFPPQDVLPTETTLAPEYWQHAWRLDRREPFTMPDLAASDDLIDRYFHGLFTIRLALNQGDLAAAAVAINAQRTMDVAPAWEVHYLPLMAEFFEARGMPDRAIRTRKAWQSLQDRAVLPLILWPDAVKPARTPLQNPAVTTTTVASDSTDDPSDSSVVTEIPPATDTTVATPDPGTPTAQPDDSTSDRVPSASGKTFAELEQQLLRDYRGMELTIRGKKATTLYQRIYRNYLLGLYYIKNRRADAAFEQLSIADRLIVDFPFPSLEMKIKIALADYYQLVDNPSRESWYRISAIQIWNAPEHLAIMASPQGPPIESPYLPLIDDVLEISRSGTDLSQVIYFTEAHHYHELRHRAYRRNALTDNVILGNQLRQVGGQLADLIAGLTERTDNTSSPKRYNDTLAIWNQLWSQVLPFYRGMEPPALRAVQAKLDRQARVLRFIEGRTQLGLMVITRDQAFSVSLGSKVAFRRFNSQERFDFLEGRLGPIWRERGATHVILTPMLQEQNFLQQLRQRMARPDDLRIHFSMQALAAGTAPENCRNIAVISEERSPRLSRFVQTLPQVGLLWVDSSRFEPRRLDNVFENRDRLFITAPMQMTGDGLQVQVDGDSFFLHEIVHYNPDVCNLTLVAPDWETSPGFFHELELVDPTGRIGIFLLNDTNQLNDIPLQIQYQGIVLP